MFKLIKINVRCTYRAWRGGGGYRLITFKKSPKNRLKVMEKRVEYVHVEL